MDRTTIIIGGLVAVALVGGLLFWGTENTNPSLSTATSTPDTTVNNGQIQTPKAPVAVTSSEASPSDTAVVVTGNVTPNGAFTTYWYEFGTTANLGNKTTNQTIGSGYDSIGAPVYITGLTKDTLYFFKLVAENQFGTATGKQFSFTTTHGVPAPVGSTPSIKTLVATDKTKNTVTFNGEINPNQASTVYWFEYGKTPNLGNTTAITSVGNGSNKVPASVSVSGLEPATIYYFRLNAQNQFGTVNGETFNVTTLGPKTASPPSATTGNATDVSTTTAMLHATIAPNGAETTYWFEYSTDPSFGDASTKTTEKRGVGSDVSPNAASVSMTITTLKAHTNYYFRAVAANLLVQIRGEIHAFKTK